MLDAPLVRLSDTGECADVLSVGRYRCNEVSYLLIVTLQSFVMILLACRHLFENDFYAVEPFFRQHSHLQTSIRPDLRLQKLRRLQRLLRHSRLTERTLEVIFQIDTDAQGRTAGLFR